MITILNNKYLFYTLGYFLFVISDNLFDFALTITVGFLFPHILSLFLVCMVFFLPYFIVHYFRKIFNFKEMIFVFFFNIVEKCFIFDNRPVYYLFDMNFKILCSFLLIRLINYLFFLKYRLNDDANSLFSYIALQMLFNSIWAYYIIATIFLFIGLL